MGEITGDSNKENIINTAVYKENGNIILFIDEIHRMQRTVEEYLYSAMEDYVIDIMIDQGANARSIRLELPKFTLIGATTKEEYKKFIQNYDTYINENAEKFTVSEYTYAVIGSCAAYHYLDDDRYLCTAKRFGQLIVSKVTPQGNIPAEHYEAPVGKHLVDAIYPVNWALLGLQSLSSLCPEFKGQFQKVMDLVLTIQDKSSEPQYAGSWRGMYDMEQRIWGGGDCFEGGAGSIYTGWTNAPISSVIAMELLKRNLFSK